MWFFLVACASTPSPTHDWSKIDADAEQVQTDYAGCLKFANQTKTRKKHELGYARGDLSRKFQSRSNDRHGRIIGLEVSTGYIRYCMYQLGYSSELERNRLPMGVQKLVDGNPNILRLVNEEPMVAYVDEYQPERLHKAFAISPSGAWSWAARAASPREAMDRALYSCGKVRLTEQKLECVVINLDGVWQSGEKKQLEY